MIDIRDAYRRALHDFGERLHLVRDDQWELPTPCVDWDVRELVNHLVNENLLAPELLAGRRITDIAGMYEEDVLGDDPIKAFEVSAQNAVEAVYAEGALTRVAHLPFGDVPGREYISELFADALIHTWDLAHAIGASERLDPELVASCAEWFERTREDYQETGLIAEPVNVPEDADQQTRLLAAWGRVPAPRSGNGDDSAARRRAPR
ncbi:TIGR03086 family protein [Thermobispora bispora]|uniref:TIGR03086 family metal-binding protein n=1 Tax=Thermobispora bispora TaxID=2006 RepID=UPI00197DBB38|nr:TIGR03086 family metal-binding protein [Thermobispora bispora]MBO2475454.1 TIGR03086 family protein [Actinomycetales bacterium]MBX6169206.1 TIGR03086 family protein [Thermobispora bispora]MDI9581082.1 TIGR03086 family metal-binding protein [Thermobispora sp.]QSI48907.1 TIGR03086 family protein [Thermobispora bispora]